MGRRKSARAWPESRKQANGKTAWRIRYRDPITGETLTAGTAHTAPERAAMLAEVNTALLTNSVPNYSAEETLRVAAQTFYDDHLPDWRSRTAASWRNFLRSSVVGEPGYTEGDPRRARYGARLAPRGFLADMQIVAINEAHIERWRRVLADTGVGDQSIRFYTHRLHMIFGYAIKRRVAVRNPVEHVDPWKSRQAPKSRTVAVSEQQVRDWVAATRPELRAALLCQAGLALRSGELLGLKVTDIQWAHQIVTVRRQAHQDTQEFVAPKTAAATRDVPLPDWLAATLREHLAQWPPLPDGLLFYNPSTGRPWWRSRFTSLLRQARIAAGLPDWVVPHKLRDHWAATKISQGLSPNEIYPQFGHASPKLIYAAVYGKPSAGAGERIRQAGDAVSYGQASTAAEPLPAETAALADATATVDGALAEAFEERGSEPRR